MILKQTVGLPKYSWIVTIYYNIKHIDNIVHDLKEAECSEERLDQIINFLKEDSKNTGCIFTNRLLKRSIIFICKSTSIGEFINTVEHEKNHLEMHICRAIGIDPYSEEAAILSGDISQIFIDDILSEIIEIHNNQDA